MQDKTLTCRDCGAEFVFTASEQEFFAQKGFTNEPGRCPGCRVLRKTQMGGSSYNRPIRESRSDREMFPAVCAQCGKATQVPFQPREDRPVYCSDCFSTRRPGPITGHQERRPAFRSQDKRPSRGGFQRYSSTAPRGRW